ncbi:MAG: polysaccharide deacetylase family protein [Rhodothermales bacterium]
MPDFAPIPCCIEAPPAFVPKARWALDALLAPLGLAPVWTERDALDAGLYYGPTPDGLPADVLALRLHPATTDYFDSGEVYDPNGASKLAWDGERWPVLFPYEQPAPADLIASAFFWLSGWQEVTTRERDEHGRFPYRASLQATLGCAAQPVVDVYREVLADKLAALGVPVRRQLWEGKAWAVALSHDVDLLRKRRLGTVARSFVRRDGQRGAALRQAALAPDPRRESLRRMAEAEQERGVGATYFFKTAARGPWDVPYAHDSPTLRRLVAGLEADGFEIGLHPSYFGHDHPGHLAEERDRLARLLGAPPVSVRQHFLRFDEATPRLQHAAGFRIDSTLGFSRHEGFRRGTCFPFRLFDMRMNAPLDLWEVPLVAMDTTLFMHRGLDGSEAERVLGDLFAACRRVGGCCTVLWHNTTYDELDYPGHAAVFERTLDRAIAEGAAVLSVRDAVAAVEPARAGRG